MRTVVLLVRTVLLLCAVVGWRRVVRGILYQEGYLLVLRVSLGQLTVLNYILMCEQRDLHLPLLKLGDAGVLLNYGEEALVLALEEVVVDLVLVGRDDLLDVLEDLVLEVNGQVFLEVVVSLVLDFVQVVDHEAEVVRELVDLLDLLLQIKLVYLLQLDG